MNFWQPLKGRHLTKNNRFISLLRDVAPIPPSPYDLTIATTSEDLRQIQALLVAHFGAPPTTPAFAPPLHLTDIHMMARRRSDGALRGCVRLSNANGAFEGHRIQTIDCLCVHPEDRQTQRLVPQLLATLHRHAVPLGHLYHLFLKEGRPIPGLSPVYSSTYAFRRRREDLKPLLTPRHITTALANRLIKAYQRIYPSALYLGFDTPNQDWWFWKRGSAWALACVQNAYQTHPEGGRIGLWTALFRSEDADAEEAFEAMVDMAAYKWNWTDRVFVRERGSWSEDGPFHWYTYQWSTNAVPGANYGILVI